MKTTLKKGQKVKFVVSSAEEAVSLLREQLGANAKVLSVRQVEGKGLAKFLTAPKLEVIATLADEEPETPVAAAPKVEAKPAATKFSEEEKALLEDKPAKAGKPESKLVAVLKASGFDNALLRRFELSTDWEKLQKTSVKAALSDLARRLTLDYQALVIPPATQTIAFLGSAGVGKTTALCKQLAYEVFFERRSVQVLKLDGGTPNDDTALGLYCEVMGVQLLRDPKEIDPTHALLVDTTGISLSDPEEVAALKKRLDELGVKTRAWVVNAAYENSLIDRSLALAEELGATHSVYTHLDELSSTSRLWHFVLSGRLPPLFGCTGPGVAHDRSAEVGPILLQKTFPEYLLK